MAGSLPDIEALTLEDLKGLVLQLLEDVAGLKVENAALREEVARLKGHKGPPRFRSSGLEKASEAGSAGSGRRRAGAAASSPGLLAEGDRGVGSGGLSLQGV